jgi:zinc transporter 1
VKGTRLIYSEHGHSHGHSHGPVALPVDDADDGTPLNSGRPRADSMSSLYAHPAATRAQVIETAAEFGYGKVQSPTDEGFSGPMSPPVKHGRVGSVSRRIKRDSSSRPGSRRQGSQSVVVPQPGSNETLPPHDLSLSSTASTATAVQSSVHGHDHDEHAGHKHSNGSAGKQDKHVHMAQDIGTAEEGHDHDHDEAGHDHSHGGESGSGGHGHSHGSMNMRGVFLHVLGDAYVVLYLSFTTSMLTGTRLGNVGVIAAGLVIWL